jgi:5-formyltetrahydrofolate cyclo-ligase
MPKRSIRSQMLDRRNALTAERCSEVGALVQERLLATEWFAAARTVALYSPIRGEVPTGAIAARALSEGKQLAYPCVDGELLGFFVVTDPLDLEPGAFGVLEPPRRLQLALAALDLIVVPGLAFDRQGHRLGYGRGFYDRTLVESRPGCVAVGLAYDFQLTAALPVQKHDRALAAVVTETGVIDCSAAGSISAASDNNKPIS